MVTRSPCAAARLPDTRPTGCVSQLHSTENNNRNNSEVTNVKCEGGGWPTAAAIQTREGPEPCQHRNSEATSAQNDSGGCTSPCEREAVSARRQ